LRGIEPGSDENASAGKLFLMQTTRSMKNEERAMQLESCLYMGDPGSASGSPH